MSIPREELYTYRVEWSEEDQEFVGTGTTHAHAGQTLFRYKDSRAAGNHPCTRGADLSVVADVKVRCEPPMHTRGRRLLTRYNVRMSAKLYSVACIMQ